MFPILKLPLVPRLTVLKNLDISELINISLTSEYIYQLVKMIKRRAYEIVYEVNEGRISVKETGSYVWPFFDYQENVLAGVQSEREIEKCLKAFFDMFQYKKTCISICSTDRRQPVEVPKVIWKFPWTEGVCNSPVSVECLTALLSHENFENLNIDSFEMGDFIYTGPLKPKHIWFEVRPPWLPLTSLYTSECDSLTLDCHDTTVNSINDFVKNWIITGQPAKLARLVFMSTALDLSGFLEGIDTFQWEERPETFRRRTVICDQSETVEIKANNGNIASFSIFEYRFIVMYSWINE